MVEGLEILTLLASNYELFANIAMSYIFWEYDENGVPSLLRDGEFLSFIEADQIPLVRVARSQSDLFSTSTPPWSASAPVSF